MANWTSFTPTPRIGKFLNGRLESLKQVFSSFRQPGFQEVGNTADENTALKEIANRIVTQQLAAEPAPVALDVTLPERGTVLTFGRSVQVDGKRPMAITLSLKRSGSGFAWLAVLLCLLLGVMGGAKLGPRVSRLARERKDNAVEADAAAH